MKSFVAVLALVAVAAADVSHIVRSPEADSVILKQAADVAPNGYQFEFETSNGIAGQESGTLENAGREDESISVQGANSYTSPEGQKVQLTFIADKNGYQPQGAHLPTPPAPLPIPDYILRAIAYNEAHPQSTPELLRKN